MMLNILCLAIGLSAQTHEMPMNEKITATNVLEQLINETGIDNKNVIMQVVTFPPLNVGAAHRHPCPLFAYVLEGELESTFEGKTYHYKKGDAFYEFKNGLHESTRNPDAKNAARLLVFYISEKGDATYISEKN